MYIKKLRWLMAEITGAELQQQTLKDHENTAYYGLKGTEDMSESDILLELKTRFGEYGVGTLVNMMNDKDFSPAEKEKVLLGIDNDTGSTT